MPWHIQRSATLGLLLALVVCLPAAAGAQQAQRQPAQRDRLPISVERIKDRLEKQPAPRLKVDVQPVVVFRSSVEREYLDSFEEQLRKEFKLNTLQRQSQEWASKGRGLNLMQLAKGVKSAYRDYQARRIEREVTQERLQVEAAARRSGSTPQ